MSKYSEKLKLLYLYQNIIICTLIFFSTYEIIYTCLNWNKNVNCITKINYYTIISTLSIFPYIKFISIKYDKYNFIICLCSLLFNFILMVWNSLQYTNYGCLNDNVFLWINTIILFIIQTIFTIILLSVSFTLFNKNKNKNINNINTTAYIIETEMIRETDIKIINDQNPVNIIATPVNII